MIKSPWHGNILNTVEKNLLGLEALKLTTQQKIELEVIYMSIKTDVLP